MASPASNYNVHATVGLHAARPATSIGFEAGNLWIETDTSQIFVAAKVGAAYVWLEMAGGGANAIWPKYVVAPPTGGPG